MTFDAADPDLVWHYTDGPGLLGILANHCLWATSSGFLNDKQEVALGSRLLTERFVERAGDLLGGGELADQFTARVHSMIEEGRTPSASQFFILSAAQTWDSLAMWRLYRGAGGQAESSAIGLDAREPLTIHAEGVEDVEGDRLWIGRTAWRPVVYRPEAQRALVDSFIDEMIALGPRLKHASRAFVDGADVSRGDAQRLRDLMQEALLLIKHPGFADERETRYAAVVFADPDDAGARATEARLLRYRASAYGIAPYLCLTGPDPQAPGTGAVTGRRRPLPIRAVAISPSPNGDAAGASVRALLRAHGYDGAQVLRSAIPFRS